MDHLEPRRRVIFLEAATRRHAADYETVEPCALMLEKLQCTSTRTNRSWESEDTFTLNFPCFLSRFKESEGSKNLEHLNTVNDRFEQICAVETCQILLRRQSITPAPNL